MAKSMEKANSIPHFSYCDEYEMTHLIQFRNQIKSVGKERGVSISYLPLIIKVKFIFYFKLELKREKKWLEKFNSRFRLAH
jgi:hypothetical protein